MSLSCPTESTSFFEFTTCIGLRVLLIFGNLVFLILNYSSFLNKALGMDCIVKRFLGSTSRFADPPLVPLPLPAVVTTLDKGASLSVGCSASLGHLPGGLTRLTPCQPGAHFLPGSCTWVGDSVETVFLPGLMRVVNCQSSSTPWVFSGWPMGLQRSILIALQSSGMPVSSFSRRFPSWAVQHQSRLVPEVGFQHGLWEPLS